MSHHRRRPTSASRSPGASRLLGRIAGALLLGALASPLVTPSAQADWTALPSNQPTWRDACDTIATQLRGGTLIDIKPLYNSGGSLWAIQCHTQVSSPPTVYEDLTQPSCSGSYLSNATTSTGCIHAASAREWSQMPSGLDKKLMAPEDQNSCGDTGEVKSKDPASKQPQSYFRPVSGGAEVGNPLNVANGNKHQEVVDFTTPAPNRLEFRRYYNSYRTRKGILGVGWSSTFERSINPSGLWLVRPSEAGYGFRKSGSSYLPRTKIGLLYKDLKDIDTRAGIVGNEILITDNSGLMEIYDKTSGRLKALRWRNGYRQDVTFNANGQVDQVTDSHGRTLSFTYANDLLETMTDPDGRVTKYQYQSPNLFTGVSGAPADQLASVLYPDATPLDDSDNPTETYHYEDNRHAYALTGITDENGDRFATWSYSASMRVVSSEHGAGVNRYTVTFHGNGTRTVTNPLGKQTVYHAPTVQYRTKISKIEGLASTNCPAANTNFTYNSRGYLSSVTNRRGIKTTFVRNTIGQELSRNEAVGTTEARSFSSAWSNRQPTSIVRPGRNEAMTYDSTGRLLTRTETDTTSHSVPYSTNGETRTWTYTYNVDGWLETVDGPLPGSADTTAYAYDANGLVSQITNAEGHIVKITSRSASGYPLTIENANGLVTTLTYDERDRVTAIARPSPFGSATTNLTYDLAGQVTRITLPDNATLDFEYDSAHRLTAIENGAGERVEYTLDAMGSRTKVEIKAAGGALARSQSRVYDELGRVLDIVGAAGQTTSVGYDLESNPTTVTDGLNHTTTTAYDSLDRPTSVTDALSGVATLAYDARDGLASATDQRNLTTSYVRNGFGEVIQETSPDTGVTVYQRDNRGLVTQKTDARAVVTDYAYDLLGRVTAVTFPANPSETITYSYDDTTAGNVGIGRLTGMSDPSGSTAWVYDAAGNLAEETRTIGGLAYSTEYAYDLADRLLQLTYPSGRIVTYARDALGRVTSVTTQASSGAPLVTVATGLTYKPFGPVTSYGAGNGLTVTLAYDQDYRLTSRTTSASVQDLAYGYDAVNSITLLTDNLNTSRTQVFDYDALQRLTDATGLYGDIDYAYDAVGNRSSRVIDDGGIVTSESYSYATTSNRLETVDDGAVIRSFSYDAAGNITDDDRGPGEDYDLTYDDRGRLTRLTKNGLTQTHYALNGAGERVSKVQAGTTSHYHYDAGGALLAESDDLGNPTTEYIALAGLPLALVDHSGGPAKVLRVHTDHLGTPQAMTDDLGSVVWERHQRPFGETASQTGTASNDRRFPGQLFDAESGYHYNYFRDYDPSIGRYLQSDPIGLAGGLNTYAYAFSDPVNLVDPSGLSPLLEHGLPDFLKELFGPINYCPAPANPDFSMPNGVFSEDNSDDDGSSSDEKSNNDKVSDDAIADLIKDLEPERDAKGRPRKGQYEKEGGNVQEDFDNLPGTVNEESGIKIMPDKTEVDIHISSGKSGGKTGPNKGKKTLGFKRPDGKGNVKIRYK